MRILILIAIGLLVYIIVANLLRKMKEESQSKIVDSAQMVQCAYCSLHILEEEAIKKDQKFYCSTAHAKEDNK